MGGISVDQLPGLFEGYLVDQTPADVQGLRDRGNAHAVNRQALEDPAGAAVGELGVPLRAHELLLKDLCRTGGVGAGETG